MRRSGPSIDRGQSSRDWQDREIFAVLTDLHAHGLARIDPSTRPSVSDHRAGRRKLVQSSEFGTGGSPAVFASDDGSAFCILRSTRGSCPPKSRPRHHTSELSTAPAPSKWFEHSGVESTCRRLASGTAWIRKSRGSANAVDSQRTGNVVLLGITLLDQDIPVMVGATPI